MSPQPTHLDLCSGIGGFALAAQWAGLRTIAFCEPDPFCQSVLRRHWPDIPIIENIKDIYRFAHEYENESFDETWCVRHGKPFAECACIGCPQWDDEYGPVDLLTAGFPCQPASVIGQRRGKEDDRWLWPEVLRIIKSIQPRWCLLENVVGLVSLGLDDVLADLETAGYETGTTIIPACSVGAPHRPETYHA